LHQNSTQPFGKRLEKGCYIALVDLLLVFWLNLFLKGWKKVATLLWLIYCWFLAQPFLKRLEKGC
jgi:hypothetical protein